MLDSKRQSFFRVPSEFFLLSLLGPTMIKPELPTVKAFGTISWYGLVRLGICRDHLLARVHVTQHPLQDRLHIGP